MAEINIDAIKPNSKTYHREEEKRKERKKVDPIKRHGKIVSTKKSFGKRMWDLFVGQDPKEMVTHFIYDVLIPGIKYAVLDGISVALTGEMFDGRRRSSGGRYDYRGSYGKSRYGSVSSSKKRNSDGYERNERVDYRNIKLDNRYDAEELVSRMKDRIYDTGSVSIAEMFDMLELPSRFTDNDWGWKDERDIGIRVSGRSFLIDVAEAIHLD